MRALGCLLLFLILIVLGNVEQRLGRIAEALERRLVNVVVSK